MTLDQMVGWSDLHSAVRQRLTAASAQGRGQWEKVLDLIEGRIGSGVPKEAPPIDDHEWRLIGIQIEGFRGIGGMLRVHPDPAPGLTVVHAPNGSGKSSLAEAVLRALGGQGPEGSKSTPWRAHDRATGAVQCCIEVELSFGTDRLVLRWDSERGSSSVHRTLDGSHEVSVTDPTWQSAMLAFAPVFAYVTLQDHLATSTALQEYLEALLALGPCFAELRADVAERANEAKSAAERLKNEKRRANEAVDTVDQRYQDLGELILPPLSWPRLFTKDVDHWLAEQALDGAATIVAYRPPAGLLDKACESGETVRQQLDALTALETGIDLDDRLCAPLDELHAALKDNPPDQGSCPVCGTAEVDWFAHLTEVSRSLAGWSHLRRSLAAALDGIEEIARDDLRPFLAAAGEAAVVDESLTTLGTALRRFATALAGSRGAVTAERRAAARELTDFLRNGEFAVLVGTVGQRCGLREQWTAERRTAVESLVELWRNTGRLAEEASDWAEALKKLTTLQNSLRADRGGTLTDQLDAVLRRLLPEEGISVTDVEFRTTKDGDALRLTRQRGAATEPIRLGMLSGGQRNALLLAPLLRLPSGGPFRFLLIDDPVHAFDDMRIDLLSGELLRLAEHRRVIVLTHDARLHEVLLARRPDAQLMTLERDPATAEVKARQRNQPWQSLLADADELVKMVSLGAVMVRDSRLPGLIRGLCRHAIDGALRQLALRWAVLSKADPWATVAEFDKVMDTRSRLTYATRYHLDGEGGPVPAVRELCEPFLGGWNAAVHARGEPNLKDYGRRSPLPTKRASSLLSGANGEYRVVGPGPPVARVAGAPGGRAVRAARLCAGIRVRSRGSVAQVRMPPTQPAGLLGP